MSKLIWEQIDVQPNGTIIERAEIFGGWLVTSTTDALTPQYNGYSTPQHHAEGYQWRTSITFVADPAHQWKI